VDNAKADGPEIMFGIDRMGLAVREPAERLGEVEKFILACALAAPFGMLLAGLLDQGLVP
jgi:hypothetical protein